MQIEIKMQKTSCPSPSRILWKHLWETYQDTIILLANSSPFCTFQHTFTYNSTDTRDKVKARIYKDLLMAGKRHRTALSVVSTAPSWLGATMEHRPKHNPILQLLEQQQFNSDLIKDLRPEKHGGDSSHFLLSTSFIQKDTQWQTIGSKLTCWVNKHHRTHLLSHRLCFS